MTGVQTCALPIFGDTNGVYISTDRYRIVVATLNTIYMGLLNPSTGTYSYYLINNNNPNSGIVFNSLIDPLVDLPSIIRYQYNWQFP